MHRIAAAGLLALAVAAQVSATATVGPVRRLDDGEPWCQNNPMVAPLRSGGFAVAWDRYSGENAGVHFRLADANGRLSGPAGLFRGRLLRALLADDSGDLMAIWGATTGPGLWMQRLSSSGQPLGAEVPLPIISSYYQLAAALAPDGRFAAVWQDGEKVRGRWFSASGSPLGPEIEIGRAPAWLYPPRRVAALIDSEGRLVAAWSHQQPPAQGTPFALRFQRFDVQGNAAGPAVDASADALPPAFERVPALAALPDGGIAVAWERTEKPEANPFVWFRRFDGSDHPIEPPAEAAPDAPIGTAPTFVSDGGGRLALAWYGSKTGSVRLLGPSGPPGPVLPLHVEGPKDYGSFEMPSLAFLAGGRLALAWNTFNFSYTIPTACENDGIYERVVDLAPSVRPPQAAGAEVRLSGPDPQKGQRPRIALAPDGGWMAVWEADCNVLRGRAFDAAGNPRAPGIELGRGPCGGRTLSAALTGLPGGGFVAAWTDDGPGGRIRVRRLGPDGQPVGPELAAGSPGSRKPQLAPQLAPGTGGFLLAWSEPPSGTILAQPFREDGSPLAANTTPVPVAEGAVQDLFDLAALPGGRFVVAWNGSETQVLARLLDPSGVPAGPEIPVSSGDLKQGYAHAAPSGDGFAVAWTAWSPPFPAGFSARLRRFGPDGQPRGEEIEADALVENGASDFTTLLVEDLTSSREGVLWLLVTKGYQFFRPEAHLTGVAVVDGEPLGPPVEIGSGDDIVGAGAAAEGCGWIVGWGTRVSLNFKAQARRFEGGCLDRPGLLRLGGGRFLAEVTWRTPDGGSGIGKTRALADDTGAFWFFWQDNLELMLKVLDGRSVNGTFWVFYATLTDVAFDLAVTDLETGTTKVYSKPAGRLESRADVNAFPAPGASSAAAHPAESRWQASPASQAASASATGCVVSDGTLCLLGSRFRVGVRFTDPRDGIERQAVAVPLTSDAGAYWFFGEDNLELMLKIVDGRPLNGRFWVFYGGLSDVEYEITVTDTETGAERIYGNARGELKSRADTSAFP
jgi:hypothetical protein